MKKPFYASQLVDIVDVLESMGLAPIVAEGVAEKLATDNGVLSDDTFDFEIVDEDEESSLS
jgi:hypothetical protein